MAVHFRRVKGVIGRSKGNMNNRHSAINAEIVEINSSIVDKEILS